MGAQLRFPQMLAKKLVTTKELTTPSARIPREVPALPKGHVPRKAILDGIKRMLFSDVASFMAVFLPA